MMLVLSAAWISLASGAERLYYSLNIPKTINSIALDKSDDTKEASLVDGSEWCFDVDPATGTLYWSPWVSTGTGVYRMAYGGQGQADAHRAINSITVAKTGDYKKGGCAFSTDSGSLSKMYWSHGKQQTKITQATVTATGYFTDETEINADMTALDCIPQRLHYSNHIGKLFWGSSSPGRGIYMSDPDGSNAQRIVDLSAETSAAAAPQGMTSLDDNYLYFTSAGLARVKITGGVAGNVERLVSSTKSLSDVACKSPGDGVAYVRCWLSDSSGIGVKGKIYSWGYGQTDLTLWYEPSKAGIYSLKIVDVTLPTSTTTTATGTTLTATATTTTVTTTIVTATNTTTTGSTTITTIANTGVASSAIMIFRTSAMTSFLVLSPLLALMLW